jgi:tetratricopeptide (TPR) repeat protein
VALFRKKPPEPDNGSGGGEESVFTPQPEKARKWFETGKTAADSFNYDYALTCYASGIKLDPATMSAHEAMLEVAVKYMNKGGKPASGKELRELAENGSLIHKFAAAEYAWMKDIRSAKLGLRAIEAAIKADQKEWGHWVAPRVLKLIRGQKKKPGKSLLVSAMELFSQVECWDEALIVGNMAREIDPADGQLSADLNNLSVQRAMEEGGYERAAGEEGGYLEMVRDLEKQKEL